MNSLKVDLPALWLFLGGYLHQDWPDDYETPEAAFRDFLASEPQDTLNIAAELTAVLQAGHDEATLEQLVLDSGSFYLPSREGRTTTSWLEGLLAMSRRTQEQP